MAYIITFFMCLAAFVALYGIMELIFIWIATKIRDGKRETNQENNEKIPGDKG